MNDFDGDRNKDVVVGSPNATVGGASQAGRVQVRLSGGGVVNLTAPGVPHAGDHFGAAVGDVDLSSRSGALSCSSLVVGAPGEYLDGETRAEERCVVQERRSRSTRHH